MPITDRKVTALIGLSGCEKSMLLRSFNRMHDLYSGNRYKGEIRLFHENRNLIEMDPDMVRLRISMVFQKPNPFPKSIFENVAVGLRIQSIQNSRKIEDGTQLLFIAKGLKRAGDHVTNIAEEVSFMITGFPLRSPRQKVGELL